MASRRRRSASMDDAVDLRLGGRRGAFEKIEVAALVGLRDVLLIERAEAALELRRRLLPRGAAARELGVAHLELELARRHVELDQVAVAHERQRAADERLRRDVQHARAVARAAHARVGDAHHVAHALREQLLRDRQLAPLGHAGRAERARVLQHEHRIRRSPAAPDRRCAPPCRCSRRRRRRGRVCCSSRGSAAAGLITAPSGARLPRSTARLPLGDQRLVARQDHVVVEHLGAGDVLAERLAVDRARVERQQVADARPAARASRRRRRNPPSGTCRRAGCWRAAASCARARRSGRASAARRRGAPSRPGGRPRWSSRRARAPS